MTAHSKTLIALLIAVCGALAHACSPPPPTSEKDHRAFFDHIAGKYQFTALVLGEEEVKVQVSNFGANSTVTVSALRVRVVESAHAELPPSKEFIFYGWRVGGACESIPTSLSLKDASIGATVRVGTNDLKAARLLKY